MKKAILILFLAGALSANAQTLVDVKREIKEVRQNIHHYRVSEKVISNASLEAVVRFFKDKQGIIRKVVASVEYEGGERELGRYIFTKDGTLVFSFVKSWMEFAHQKKCQLKIRSFYAKDGNKLTLLKRDRIEPKIRQCKKLSKDDISVFPILPLKLVRPRKIISIIKSF
jgi:hypothetical protein